MLVGDEAGVAEAHGSSVSATCRAWRSASRGRRGSTMPSPASIRSPSTGSAASSTPTWSCSTTSFRPSRQSRRRSTASWSSARPATSMCEGPRPNGASRAELRRRALDEGRSRGPTAIDYFVFTAGPVRPAAAVRRRPRSLRQLAGLAGARARAGRRRDRAVVAVHQRHDYAHVTGGFEDEAHFGDEARRNEDLAGGAADLHDLRREPSPAARRRRQALRWLHASSPRESAQGRLEARSARSVACADGRPRPHILVLNQYYKPGVEATANLLADLCESLAEEFRRDRRDRPTAQGRAELPSEEVLNGVHVLRTRSTAFDRTKLQVPGTELHHLSGWTALSRARSRASPGPRALHDGSADRRRFPHFRSLGGWGRAAAGDQRGRLPRDCDGARTG